MKDNNGASVYGNDLFRMRERFAGVIAKQRGFVIMGQVMPAMCCSILGGWIGEKLALTRGARLIRYVLRGTLALLTVTMAVDLFL